jgi:hypothetical protein
MRTTHDELERSTVYLSVFPSDSSQKQYLEQLQARPPDRHARATH